MEPDSVDACVANMIARYPQIDPDVEGVVDRMSTIQKHATRIFGETLAEHGLSHGEYLLLLRLATRAADHRMSAGDLSRSLLLSTGAMTNRLDRLEKAGLVRRVADPNDRRGVHVELTPKGEKAIDAAVIAQAVNDVDVVSALSARERAQLNQLLRKVLTSLEARLVTERPKVVAG